MPTAFSVRRRNRFKPDTRPDWRDPNMPCWGEWIMSDGSKQAMYIPPELRRQLAEQDLEYGMLGRSGWRLDPTYDMRRRSARTAPPARRDNSQAEHPRAVAEPAGPLIPFELDP